MMVVVIRILLECGLMNVACGASYMMWLDESRLIVLEEPSFVFCRHVTNSPDQDDQLDPPDFIEHLECGLEQLLSGLSLASRPNTVTPGHSWSLPSS